MKNNKLRGRSTKIYQSPYLSVLYTQSPFCKMFILSKRNERQLCSLNNGLSNIKIGSVLLIWWIFSLFVNRISNPAKRWRGNLIEARVWDTSCSYTKCIGINIVERRAGKTPCGFIILLPSYLFVLFEINRWWGNLIYKLLYLILAL
jgi:hypothetical protein